MSRTHRAHFSPNRLSMWGGNDRERDKTKPTTKTHKQVRPNDRARLRKEYL
jgi:hypothetical protein